LKPAAQECVVKLIGYKLFCVDFCLIWEQEVGGSNPLAPTSYLNNDGRFKRTAFFLYEALLGVLCGLVDKEVDCFCAVKLFQLCP